MRYKVRPEDFIVEEQVRASLAPGGRFAVYRVHKRGVTTLSVQAQIARALRLSRSDVVFPALKDKDAVAVQHAAVRGVGPPRLNGDGFTAVFLGGTSRPLTPADIVANHFTIVLRDLQAGEAAHIEERLAQVIQFGLPNYFDQQRFGSFAADKGDGQPVGKYILQRDAEGALHAHFTQPFAGDPAPVRKFKAFARARWRDWDALFEAAPRPSNYRSVLTYLRDHPVTGLTEPASGDSAERAMHYRKALNLITRRLLSLYLVAYQSFLWNRIAARYLAARMEPGLKSAYACVEIAGERLPVYYELPPDFDRDLTIPLPHHRAIYPPASPDGGEAGSDNIADLAAIVSQVLMEEGLSLNGLKARILNRAYLPKGGRALLLFPQEMSASSLDPDELHPGRSKLALTFTLPRGSYATLVIKALSL